MKVLGNSHVLGASEIKAKGQMTSAPDKCVDLIMALGSGGPGFAGCMSTFGDKAGLQ